MTRIMNFLSFQHEHIKLDPKSPYVFPVSKTFNGISYEYCAKL